MIRDIINPIVLKNFFSLALLQGGNYIIPLLLFPYLIRSLGQDGFGTWMFALSFVIVARVCVDYGFDLTATRQVTSTNCLRQHSELLIDVIAVKLLIWLACFITMIACVIAIPALSGIALLIFLAFPILIGEVLFPTWFFQGKEQMGPITVLRISGKLLGLVLVFCFVNSPADIHRVPIIEAFTSLLTGAASLILAYKRFKLKLVSPRASRVASQFKGGIEIFVSTLSAQFYTTTNTIFLGLIVGVGEVGIYSVAEKIYSALRGIVGTLYRALFPNLSRTHDTNYSDFEKHYNLVLRYITPLNMLIACSLIASASSIVVIVAGYSNPEMTAVLKVFALTFPFALGGFLVPMLVVRGANDLVMRISIIGGAIGVIVAPIGIFFFGAIGAAMVFGVVQVYNTIALLRANSSQRVSIKNVCQ